MINLDELIQDLNARFVGHEKRLNHIMGVYEKSIELAKMYNVDVYKASLVALLHDYTKALDDETQKQMLIDYGFDTNMSPKLYHAYTAYIIAKENFKITDIDILEAVKYHPTGYERVTDLLKVIMVADIAEERTRDYDLSIKIRELAKKSLDEAVIYKLEYLVKDAKKKNYDAVETKKMLEVEYGNFKRNY